MVAKAKVMRSGDAQAARLPDGFRLDADEVDIRHEGEAIVLTPTVTEREPWADLKAFWASGGFSDDFMKHGREQGEFTERPELDAWIEAMDQPAKSCDI